MGGPEMMMGGRRQDFPDMDGRRDFPGPHGRLNNRSPYGDEGEGEGQLRFVQDEQPAFMA